MTDEPVIGSDTSLSDSAVDQLLHGITRSHWGHSGRPGSEHAEAHGLIVVSRSVSTLTIPAPALVGTTVRAEAPVVADISPAVIVDVAVLDVAHLSGASILGGARSSGGVVDDNERSGSDRQHRGGCSTSSPLCAGHDGRAS